MHVFVSTAAAFGVLLAVAFLNAAPAAPGVPVKDDRAQIDCASVREVATPHFIARADRDAAALPAASPLVAIHGAFKRLVAACGGGQ